MRSDCHAWSAHARYHTVANILGIRPAAFGFERVLVEPHPGTVRRAAGRMPHRRGMIEVTLDRYAGVAEIVLPEGLASEWRWRGDSQPLRPGRQRIELAG